MARSKRLALSLKTDLDTVITEMAELTNQSKTTLINNLLTGLLPSLTMSVKVLRKLKISKAEEHPEILKSVVGELTEFFDDAQMQLKGLDEYTNK